jgi:2-oxoglutarate ferredoxin oxidoreductase subunit beta
MNITDFDTGHMPTWCPGCGNFGIWLSLKNALTKLNIGTNDAFIVYGVGCHGNMNDWMKVYGFAGLHGRTLPVAQGVKLANHTLQVIAVSGDGDGLGEGGNHFIQAAKRNPDITVIIHDNQVYGLTTGQASPTAKPGLKTKSTPEGVVDEPLNPIATAIVSGATFVARGFAGDTPELTDIIAAAITHKGFSVVDVLQPCVSFNKVYTYGWFRQRLYKLETEKYTPDNKLHALEKSMEWGDRIPTGIFYKEQRATSEEREATLAVGPLVENTSIPVDMDDMAAEFI